MKLAYSGGVQDVRIGEHFLDFDGCRWEVLGLTDRRIYSPSGLCGTAIIRCRLLSGEPRLYPPEHIINGVGEWCGDSLAACVAKTRANTPQQKKRRLA